MRVKLYLHGTTQVCEISSCITRDDGWVTLLDIEFRNAIRVRVDSAQRRHNIRDELLTNGYVDLADVSAERLPRDIYGFAQGHGFENLRTGLTTWKCPVCGRITETDKGHSLEHTTCNCGACVTISKHEQPTLTCEQCGLTLLSRAIDFRSQTYRCPRCHIDFPLPPKIMEVINEHWNY